MGLSTLPASDVPSAASDSGARLARVRQLRSEYDPRFALEFPLDLGDYLSLLFRLDEQQRLIEERGAGNTPSIRLAWYAACCMALGKALAVQGTALDTLSAARAYDPRQMMRGFRDGLRARHGAFQAVYHEIAIGGLLRQRADILRMGRSVVHHEGGPGSGIADETLRARIQKVYFSDFDDALLAFSAQLIELDALLLDLLPVQVGPPVVLAQLRAEHGYPDRSDPRWVAAFLA